jgi:acyl carrier protein
MDMNNLQLYNQVFIKSLNVSADELDTLTYRSIPGWDSIGHMVLIAALEEAFNIMLDSDEIIDFSSYEKGKLMLNKYNINF